MMVHPQRQQQQQTTIGNPAAASPSFVGEMSIMRRRRASGKVVDVSSSDCSIAVERSSSSSSASEWLRRRSDASGADFAAGSSSTHQRKPCHSAQLALLCVHNAMRMGARTHLSLCPPGKNRRKLQNLLQHKISKAQQQLVKLQSNSTSASTTVSSSSITTAASTTASLVKTRARFENQLEKFVGTEQLEDYIVQEEDFLMHTNTFDVDSDEEASSGDEDELININFMFSEETVDIDDHDIHDKIPEPLYVPVENSSAANSSNKLPFNRRKIRYFDHITADETARVRNYLVNELRRSKKSATLAMIQHLPAPQNDYSVNRFDGVMTPAVAAAFLLESLKVNRYESLEGMAACYDGIVAAGTALLDTPDPTQPVKMKATRRSDILAALSPLLITNLEEMSGEVIMALAKLRRLCGTPRYQRRFVQRIAPFLVRPPGAAAWCLRHQNDMEAILAATELILDAAFEIFAKNWYERGRWMLADSKRAESLVAAAAQLRDLSSDLEYGSPSGFLTRSSHHSNKRPRGETTELAESDVIDIDRQIRASISGLFEFDWRMQTCAPPRRQQQSRHTHTRSGGVLESPRGASSATPRSPRPYMSSLDLQSSSSYDRSQTPPPPSRAADSISSPKQQSWNSSIVNPPPKSPKSPRQRSTPDSSIISSQHHQQWQTPLSPSSVGTNASASEITSSRPVPTSVSSTANSNNSLSVGGSLVNTLSTPTAANASTSPSSQHYRMLTSTAAERKRTVAACRALRAQIQRFEDAFIQLHGRAPKGPSDRAPLATTYAQYREWKRAIRADAACRIQALFRGSRTRWMLSREFPEMARIIRKQRARRRGGESAAVIDRLSLPTDIMMGGDGSGTGLLPSNAAVTAMSTQWGNQPAIRPQALGGSGEGSPNSNARAAYSSASATAPGSPVPNYSTNNIPGGVVSASTSPTFADLQARKRDLKQQLKQYDMSFARRHGRMPVKAEKEPIRHLYEAYNNLKAEISRMEQEGRHLQSAPVATGPPSPTNQQQQRAVTPPSEYLDDNNNADMARGTNSRNSGSSNNRKVPLAPSLASTGSSSVSSGGSSNTANTNPNAAPDLSALKAEKQTLHTMLRSYEKEFFREHRRQVSSFADIQPVASQYRRYKEIKKLIAKLQNDQGVGQ